MSVRRSRRTGDIGRSRRLTLALAMLVTALGLLLPSSPASAQVPPGIIPEGDFTDAQAQWLVNGVRYAEQELPAFADRSKLPSMGFVNIGVLVSGVYEHWTNVEWMNDEHILDPRFPESLVYKRLPNGTYELQAAMLFVGADVTMETIPEIIRFVPGWHAHPELCSDDTGRVVGIPINGQCTRGRQVTSPMVHVWIVDNECGHRFGGLDGGGMHCDYHDDH